jgi:hypothetical protein
MQDKRPLIFGLSGALIALSTIAITARLISRGVLLKRLGPDDGMCLIQIPLWYQLIMNYTVLISIALLLAVALCSLYMLCGSCLFILSRSVLISI